MRVTSLPWIIFLLTLTATLGSWAINLAGGNIPAGLPLLDGGISISKAARAGPGLFLFRATMILAAALIGLYWLLVRRWLIDLRDTAFKTQALLVGLGLSSALFLVIYANVLGFEGPLFYALRRVGVTLYFSCNVLAHMLLTARLQRLCQRPENQHLRSVLRWKVANGGVLLTLGLISVGVTAFLAEKDTAENLLEWWFALFMTLDFMLTGQLWRRDGWQWHSSRSPQR